MEKRLKRKWGRERKDKEQDGQMHRIKTKWKFFSVNEIAQNLSPNNTVVYSFIYYDCNTHTHTHVYTRVYSICAEQELTFHISPSHWFSSPLDGLTISHFSQLWVWEHIIPLGSSFLELLPSLKRQMDFLGNFFASLGDPGLWDLCRSPDSVAGQLSCMFILYL